MIINFGKPVPCSSGNNYDVARLELVAYSVPNGRGIVSRTVQLLNSVRISRPSLLINQIGAGYQRRRAIYDVVYLAHLIVFSNGVGSWGGQFPAIDNANVNIRPSGVNRANLLINQIICDRSLYILL